MGDPAISDIMKAYAQDAERLASQHGQQLDYSETSLETVDSLLSTIAGSGVLTPKSPDEQAELWTLAKVFGGYLGEVVIRNLGGEWEMKDNQDGSASVVLLCQGVQMFPLEKVHKRLTADPYSGISGYCRALRAILERQG